MATYAIQQDDKRLGKYKPDGSIESWPTVDVDGAPYRREWATLHRMLGTNSFVVVQPKHEEYIIDWEPATAVEEVTGPEPEKVSELDADKSEMGIG